MVNGYSSVNARPESRRSPARPTKTKKINKRRKTMKSVFGKLRLSQNLLTPPCSLSVLCSAVSLPTCSPRSSLISSNVFRASACHKHFLLSSHAHKTHLASVFISKPPPPLLASDLLLFLYLEASLSGQYNVRVWLYCFGVTA